MASPHVFGTVTVILGSEQLLAERAEAKIVTAAKAHHAQMQTFELAGATATPADFLEATSGSLFAPETTVIINDGESASADLATAIVDFAMNPSPEVCLIVKHLGGAKGRGLVDKLRKAKVQITEAQPLKPRDLDKFVLAEAKAYRVTMSQDAAQSLIDAVGSDLRTLAAAIRQLADDWAGERLTADMVNKYFAGRAEVTSFAVSDDVLFGRPGPALEKLRWALSSGVAPVLVTSALANNLRSLGKYVDVRSSRMPDYEIARSIGVPSWKVKTLARQAQGWNSPALAMALVEVSRADAAVKGAATDPGYALEQLVLTIDRQRRELTRRR